VKRLKVIFPEICVKPSSEVVPLVPWRIAADKKYRLSGAGDYIFTGYNYYFFIVTAK